MLDNIFIVGFIVPFLAATVRMAVPLAYAGLGEAFSEKTGILNIGVEGIMLSGAFFSFAGAYYSHNIFIGLICGILGGILVSMIHAVLSIRMEKDQSVSGIALNIFMLGVTSFLFKLMSKGQEYQQIEKLPTIKIPILSNIPLIGDAFFNQDILTYILYILIIALIIFYKYTSLGLSFAAIGENPRAADTAGINVHKYQYIATLVNGILGGVGGAYLVLVQLGAFTENMISGRGYIALATVILGRYSPFGVFLSALLFGASNALQIRLQAMGVPLPTQVFAMLPYVITLIALFGSIGKSNEPESLGKPYIRGMR